MGSVGLLSVVRKGSGPGAWRTRGASQSTPVAAQMRERRPSIWGVRPGGSRLEKGVKDVLVVSGWFGEVGTLPRPRGCGKECVRGHSQSGGGVLGKGAHSIRETECLVWGSGLSVVRGFSPGVPQKAVSGSAGSLGFL